VIHNSSYPKKKEILFLSNQLTGLIPQGVGLFTEMQVLYVSFNSLIGHLPDTISCLEEIEVLNLGHNKLFGILLDVVCSLRSLANLTVFHNLFSGFSQDCSNLFVRSVGFDFSGNCIPRRNIQSLLFVGHRQTLKEIGAVWVIKC
jgi:hypothetical protein